MFLLPGMSCHVLWAYQNSIHPSELSSDAGPSVKPLALCHLLQRSTPCRINHPSFYAPLVLYLYLCYSTNSSVWFIINCVFISPAGLRPPLGQGVYPMPLCLLMPHSAWNTNAWDWVDTGRVLYHTNPPSKAKEHESYFSAVNIERKYNQEQSFYQVFTLQRTT